MQAPDGVTHVLTKEFVEVVPDARIVLRQLDDAHGFVMPMTFADEGDGTRLIWRMQFELPAEGERVATANAENVDRLQARLIDEAGATNA